MGVAMAGNLFTLFVVYEVLTLSTYPLVAHKEDAAAQRGARIYLMTLLATSIGLFLVALIWSYTVMIDPATGIGNTDFVEGWINCLEKSGPATASALLVLFAFGIGKAALMPIHFWLPNAMVAPTPVSALLHAVAVVKAGGVRDPESLDLHIWDRSFIGHARDRLDPRYCLFHDGGRVSYRDDKGQSQSSARLLDDRPACLCHDRCDACQPGWIYGRVDADRRARNG